MAALDAKQLHEKGRQIMKAAESGDPPSTLLSLLAPLEQVKATEDLLRQSKIGVAVTKLRQNKDPKVAETAARLVNRWKQEVNAQAKKKRAAEGSPAPTKALNGAVANGRASGTSSPAPQPKADVKQEPAKRQSKVDPKKRNSQTDGVDINVTGDGARDGCLKLMYNGLAFMSDTSPDTVLDIARRVEVAAFSLYKQETNTEYRSKMRSLFQNLKINGPLRKSVLSGAVDAKKFVTMSTDELKSAEQRARDAALEKENMNKAMTAQEVKAVSTTMTCGKCKQSKVSYTQAQTRSADEPLTTFCECTICGHRWKFS